MKAKLLIVAAGAASLLATPALAQETRSGEIAGGALTGGLTGAAIGGLVGGPIGAAVGGAVGVGVGTAGGAVVAPPPEVVSYVAEQPVPSVSLDHTVAVGEPLPASVQVYNVPRYRDYGYAVVNDQPVIVDRRIDRVVDVLQEGRAATAVAPPARVVMAPPPAPVREYVVEHDVPSVAIQREVVVGQPLPRTVTLYPVPSDRSYAYATVNDQATIVDPYTRRVVDVIPADEEIVR